MSPRGGSGARSEDGRGESLNQRLDRNWLELLQELRVMQTGIQLLTGFLLTLPFQSRFDELDRFQVVVYLCLVTLSAIITAVVLSAVNLHRVLFGLQVKDALVRSGDLIMRISIGMTGLVLAGTAGFVFDIVIGRRAGILVAVLLIALVAVLWVLYPRVVRARAVGRRTGGPV
jgi:hypothetical protein